MAICGSCPGNVFVQIGSGVENVLYTWLGTVAAALLFLFWETQFEQPAEEQPTANHIDIITQVKYSNLSMIVGLVTCGVLVALEH